MSKHLMALAFACLCSTFCSSQTGECCNHLQSNTYTCESSHCSGRVTVYTPVQEGEDLIRFSCNHSEDCCGQVFTTCTNDGGCLAASRNPEVRARIDEVATTSEVLVANCKGRYALYAPRGERTIDLDRVLATDRILR